MRARGVVLVVGLLAVLVLACRPVKKTPTPTPPPPLAESCGSPALDPGLTVAATIQDTTNPADNILENAAGEDYTVFGASPGFLPPRGCPIFGFAHLTDFQMVDEESPARVEFLDAPGGPVAGAYRPQESLTTQTTEAMVRAVRTAVSPVTGHGAGFTVITGDNADSQQYNETRWFIDILDGGSIDPNSGVPSAMCPANPSSNYDGVQGGDFYDPDASPGDGSGYSPADGVRDFPGLFVAANQPFVATGLGMPWYSAFGNHDGLIQGNSPEAYIGPTGPGNFTTPDATEAFNPPYQAIATSCDKPTSDTNPPTTRTVPPDQARCHLAKDEPDPITPGPCAQGGWIDQHFVTGGTPLGHGFEAGSDPTGYGRPPVADANDDGYYSFAPVPGLRFVVLDSITDECGVVVCAEGSIDDAQFQWLDGQLTAAAAAGEYALVFSHHTLGTTRFPSTDPTEVPLHYGTRLPGDPTDPDPQNPTGQETLEELFCEHQPTLLAHVNGHTHENAVTERGCDQLEAPLPGIPTAGEFWEVSTSAHVDWPQQSRLIELLDNGDGTMSLVLTMIDLTAPADPGAGAVPLAESIERLASIARELAYNDPQHDPDAARGGPEDRNVIVVFDRPPPGA